MTDAKNRLALLLTIATTALLALAPAAIAEDNPTDPNGFGIAAFDGEVTSGPTPDGDPELPGEQPINPADPADPANFAPPYTQASGHPYEASTTIRFNRYTHPVYGEDWPEEPVRTTIVELPPGLVGNPNAVPTCPLERVMTVQCSPSSQVGLLTIKTNHTVANKLLDWLPVYNMPHAPGSPARFGVNAFNTFIAVDAEIRSDSDYGVNLVSRSISEGVTVNQLYFTFWGVPADPVHDSLRACSKAIAVYGCSAADPDPEAFITLPSACTPAGQGLVTTLHADSWFHPDEFHTASFESHLAPGFTSVRAPFDPPLPPPLPLEQWGTFQGPSGCDAVPLDPSASVVPTTDSAQTPSGLSVEIAIPEEGLREPNSLAQSAVKKTVVALPEGVTVNPSAAEGLAACTPAQLKAETASSPLGAGCPAEARIGSVRVDTPVLEEPLEGSLFIAQQDDPGTTQPGAENPFDSLLALYIVAKQASAGVIVKLAGKVEPDPDTGQLKTTFGDPTAADPSFRQLPQLPFSKFTLRFREGQRGVLVSPQACGTYETKSEFTPYANPDQVKVSTSSFTISQGVGGGPCPSGATPPFKPGLMAGTLNNAAGRYSPFNLRLSRNDGEQEFTHFSIKLPPGVTGKLAGIPFCADSSIAAAKQKTGAQELASPSCPKASEVGRTLVGAGVGPALTYVPGKVYLAGPYNGSALSIAAITSAKVGPFDVGTVVVREALRINPETAEVFIDERDRTRSPTSSTASSSTHAISVPTSIAPTSS